LIKSGWVVGGKNSQLMGVEHPSIVI